MHDTIGHPPLNKHKFYQNGRRAAHQLLHPTSYLRLQNAHAMLECPLPRSTTSTEMRLNPPQSDRNDAGFTVGNPIQELAGHNSQHRENTFALRADRIGLDQAEPKRVGSSGDIDPFGMLRKSRQGQG
jgi:hypothetical protein